MRQNWPWMLSFTTVLVGGIAYIYARMKALERGVQALLRAQMITYWNHYHDRGSAPIYARQSFVNLWEQYEKLGKNGVMEDLYKRFMALPMDKEGES
jgi:hypothetical protein